MDASPVTGSRLTGKLQIKLKRGTKAFAAYRKMNVAEAFSCNYELNPKYLPKLEKNGIVVSGVSDDGGPRIIELPGHWFWIATGYVPQYASEPGRPHPLIVAYLQAALSLKRLKYGEGGKPETVENRWDILYRVYPEVYNEFANVPISRQWIDVARKMFTLKDKVVADIGSGSGQSTFQLARYAGKVIGIEPEDAMGEIAIREARKLDIRNIEFKKGTAAAIPLDNQSVNITISVTGAFFYDAESTRGFVKEAERITRRRGYIIIVNIAPRWYGGEVAHVILGKSRGSERNDWVDNVLRELSFGYRDYFYHTDYVTVDKAVATYGFIFGRKVIDYLHKHNMSKIKWKGRIYFKQV